MLRQDNNCKVGKQYFNLNYKNYQITIYGTNYNRKDFNNLRQETER